MPRRWRIWCCGEVSWGSKTWTGWPSWAERWWRAVSANWSKTRAAVGALEARSSFVVERQFGHVLAGHGGA